jgi:hypothetical protein
MIFDVKFDGIWRGFFGAIWRYSPINGSSVGGLVASLSSWSHRSVPGDAAAAA